jgi:hypothetical protein
MRVLHTSAAISGIVIALVGWSMPLETPAPIWRILVGFISGVALPYVVVFSWGFMVVPPSIGYLLRDRRSDRSDPEK